MVLIEGLVAALGGTAITAIYLPFLLLFAILFAVLQKSKIFDNKNIDILLSFIISLYIVAFSPVAGAIGLWFANLFAAVGVTLVSIIVFFLVVGLMVAPWWSKVLNSKNWKYLIPVGVVIGFLIILSSTFGGVGGVSGEVTIPGLSTEDLLFLTLIIVTGIIIWWMTRGPSATPKEARMLFEP